ncbi:MAG: hypothetical protein J0I93_10845, partial [Legionella sp.]|nr:hypothetical protein [Legionella sp.]
GMVLKKIWLNEAWRKGAKKMPGIPRIFLGISPKYKIKFLSMLVTRNTLHKRRTIAKSVPELYWVWAIIKFKLLIIFSIISVYHSGVFGSGAG